MFHAAWSVSRRVTSKINRLNCLLSALPFRGAWNFQKSIVVAKSHSSLVLVSPKYLKSPALPSQLSNVFHGQSAKAYSALTTEHSTMALPTLPEPIKDFIPYLVRNPETPVRELLKPYEEHEARLREVFAQSPQDQAIRDPHVNVVPLYAGHEKGLKIRARDVSTDPDNDKYISPLKDNRKTSGSPAVVESLAAFKKNFNLFSESALSDLNWDNVVVAGSAVVSSLIPVSAEHTESTRALRAYYHEQLAPSSDVDIFLWGLTSEQAVEKIKQIEKAVQNSILAETTTIRTKNAITIASQYPTRHIQIVLRLYKSVSEILTGFDVDSSCFAYDGSQVYGTPRSLAAFVTQCNSIDLTRRSPSYENRLFKYARRGFEIYCPDLDRDRIDPTIYERAFARVQGLARLLVLERLPKEEDRDAYRNQRREERARPTISQSWKDRGGKLRDNFKDKDPQDVAEWVMEEQDDVSNYHTFTVPYGPRYSAKRIERLLYTKDILLNAEWNNKGQRSVNLHRHPCFVGDFEYIKSDCCTTCPVPETDEEKKIAAEESKRFVSGNLQFLEDDPGRQAIGSFSPLTDQDWTEQAYLGNTESLCHAIVSGDAELVRSWCNDHKDKLDRRDHTGRTPLQLATQVGAVESVKVLVDSGARIISRLTDGLTALHIACINGNSEIVNILLEKSEANEELEAEKEGSRNKKAKETEIQAQKAASTREEDEEGASDNASDADSDEGFVHTDGVESDTLSMTQGSYVKVKSKGGDEEAAIEIEADEPDVYDVNILAWDAPVSPLHLAIISGHIEIVKLLVSKFGADVLLPVKLFSEYDKSPIGAFLTLYLAAQNVDRSVELTKALLDFGASPSQSDSRQISALHAATLSGNVEALKIMMEKDLPKVKSALNHIIIETESYRNNTYTPLNSCIGSKEETMVLELLKAGANPTIPFDDWAKAWLTAASGNKRLPTDKTKVAEKYAEVNQPIVDAANYGLPATVEALLDAGVDVNTVNSDGLKLLLKSSDVYCYNLGQTLLDIVEAKSEAAIPSPTIVPSPRPPTLHAERAYLDGYKKGTYQHWQIQNQYLLSKEIMGHWQTLEDDYDKYQKETRGKGNEKEVNEAKQHRAHFRRLKIRLEKAGAKKFEDLHPGVYPNGGHRWVDSRAKADDEEQPNSAGQLKLVVEFHIPSVHDTNEARYIELFEAAWTGNKDKIRRLTTIPDDTGHVVRMAVYDNMGISPLHIALWRGEYDIAEMMLEIANLQYIPPHDSNSPERRYFVRSSDKDDDFWNYFLFDEDAEDFYVSSELINQDFTIDDVASLAQQAGSKTSALDFLTWSGPFWMFDIVAGGHSTTSIGRTLHPPLLKYLSHYYAERTSTAFFQDHFAHRSGISKIDVLSFAIDTGDANLAALYLKYYKLYEPLAKKIKNKTISNFSKPSNSRYLFRALNEGHINIASELVLNAGTGMPIESLAKEAGIDTSGTSRYYQGLLINGKHKQDWAKEADKSGNKQAQEDSLRTSLLLQSVANSDVGAVEWCLSDSPARLLKQWASQTEDEQVQKLSNAQGGYNKFVDDWLGTRRNLAIHMTVLSENWESRDPKDKLAVAEVLKYLVRAIPESLETKNSTGHTPLAIAMWTRKYEAASILIAAGADQVTRDHQGANIVHLALNQIPAWNEDHLKTLDDSLALIDKKLIKDLFVQRCSLGPTGMTPLATWHWKRGAAQDDEISLGVLKIILKHADRECLGMVDGGGQMPIHGCIKSNYVKQLQYLCDEYPELVLLENGMGQTALELCSSMFTQESISPDRCPGTTFSGYSYLPLSKGTFSDPTAHSKALQILKKAQSEVSNKKRILISSLQAGEVAKRLANYKAKRDARRYMTWQEKAELEAKIQDEVEKWLYDNDYWKFD